MKRILKKFSLVFIPLVLGATAKTASETDLTSDFTSTVDDQYPWSALLPPRGPTDQDTNESSWTNTDRNDNALKDRYLHSPLRKSSLLSGKDTRPIPFGEKYDDKGPRLDIYRLNIVDEKESNSLDNSKWDGIKLKKSKIPKKVWFNRERIIMEGRKNDDRLNPRAFGVGGVPELQIGCEGLEAPQPQPKESNNRESRSIFNETESTVGYTPVDSKQPPILNIARPVLDSDYYIDNEDEYEDVDELKFWKNKKTSQQNERVNRGDMSPEVASTVLEPDSEKLPTRGDLPRRKERSVGNMRGEKTYEKEEEEDNDNEKDEKLWGFGEDDGMISDDDDETLENSENEIRRIEEDKRKREWDRRRMEEIERRRQYQQSKKRDENRVNSEIDRITMEYEGRLAKQHEEQERKLKEYIERNRPIVVDRPEDRRRKHQEEMNRRNMANNYQRGGPSVVHSDRSRGPSAPPAVANRDDELRIRQEAQRRRNQELARRYEEQKLAQRYEHERQQHLMEQKRPELGVISLQEAERKHLEEERLKSLPISARIIITPNSTPKSNIFNRGNFDDDIGLAAINPYRPGLEAKRFPAPKTPKPPSRQPGPCVWAVTQCCPNRDIRKLTACFEFMGCPGINWDPSPCAANVAKAAIDEVQRFYASADRRG